jgi:hypothetical protein
VKIIFLDIDGVLNHADFLYGKHPVTSAADNYPHSVEAFDPAALARLQRIIDATGAAIVISSSWRVIFKCEEIVAWLRNRGLRARFAGKTGRILTPHPNGTGQEEVPRSDEIGDWLAGCPDVTAYVILDDDGDAEIAGHYVGTDWETGLLDEHVEAAIAVLGGVGTFSDAETIERAREKRERKAAKRRDNAGGGS